MARVATPEQRRRGVGIDREHCYTARVQASGSVVLMCEGPARWRAGPLAGERAVVLAEATGAVPLLWLALFDYDDARTRASDKRMAFVAASALPPIRARAAALERMVGPTAQPRLQLGAALLARTLDELDQHVARVVLDTGALLGPLDPAAAAAYTERLISVCDLWQSAREQSWDWTDLWEQLRLLVPELDRSLTLPDERASLYALVGTLAERADDLEHLAVREGQARGDTQPQALAVGDGGLVLGRFSGVWKLMVSGCDADLHDVWSDGAAAFAVGDAGTLLQLGSDGQWKRVQVPTSRALHRVRPVGDEIILAAGAGGELIARVGGAWQRLSSPTQSTLRALWGQGPHDMCIGGEVDQIWRYDGYAWNALGLPTGSRGVNDVVATESRLAAVGSGKNQGDVFWLTPRGVLSDGRLDSAAPIEAAFLGWNRQLNLVAGDGEVLTLENETWSRVRLRAHGGSAAHQGDFAALVGRYARYGVIWENHGKGWEPTIAVDGSALRGVWCAGCAKPPRLGANRTRRPETISGRG